MKKEVFCGKPFSGLFLSPNGDVKFCCALNESLGNINEDSVENIINNDLSNDIRNSILNDKWHSACSYCKKAEEHGGSSERTGTLNSIDEFENTNTFQLKEVDLRWSNTCNLTCNYCNPLFSSKWAQILNEKVNKNKEHAEETLIEYIKNNKSLKTIMLLGGEPLLQKQNEILLNNIGDVHVNVLTNLSVDLPNSKIFNQIKNLPNVQWNVSFETIKEKFEYVRHGANWDVFTNNLRFLSNNTQRQIGAQPVYCMYSAFDLCDFYDFIDSEGYFGFVTWQILNNPIELDVFNHNKKIKSRAISEIEKCEEKYDKYDLSILINIKEKLITSFDFNSTNNLNKFNDRLENTLLNKKNKFSNLYTSIYDDLNNG